LDRIAAAVSGSSAETRPTLLVEDNPAESRAMTQALEQAGFPVVCVATVGEAMATVEADRKFLAAIVDMNLPDASGGLVVWQLRRRFWKDLPVAVVTGMHNPLAERNLASYPPDRLFPKPLDVEQLIAWVRSVRTGNIGG
jgi:DNA-binding response OmpR family regulator